MALGDGGRREPGARKPAEKVCEVSFLDFAGEVYRAAYGISGSGDASLKEQAEELKQYVCGADELIVLINLRDVITNGLRDKRVQEAMWITKSILDTALGDDTGEKAPRAAIVLSQADSYAETIKTCGGALGVLEKYLPHVANDYGWLDVFAVNAVDKTDLDGDGNVVPAADSALPDDGRARIPAAPQRDNGAPGVCALPGGPRLSRPNEESPVHGKVQLWKKGPYWAEKNIGAEPPWESGYYFWWGDTVGYEFKDGVWMASDGSKSKFSFEETNGKTNLCSKLFGKKANIPTLEKDISTLRNEGWITRNGALTLEHDAAHVKWGGEWRMPTDQELKNLNDKCDWVWTQMNGVCGYVVCGRGEYASARIFLPCAGYGNGTSLDYAGSHGSYWSSVPLSDDGYRAWSLGFDSGGRGSRSIGYRYGGYPVRPVQGFTK